MTSKRILLKGFILIEHTQAIVENLIGNILKFKEHALDKIKAIDYNIVYLNVIETHFIMLNVYLVHLIKIFFVDRQL